MRIESIHFRKWIEFSCGLEWNVGGRSLRHMTCVHRHSQMTSVCGDEGSVGYTRVDADVKTQLDEIIRNKAICQKVANAVAQRGYIRTREQCRPRSY